MTLYLEKAAVILGSPDAADYRNLDPFLDGAGEPMGYSLIVAVGADHPCLEGSGTVDGQGVKVYHKQNPFLIRPFLVRRVALHECGDARCAPGESRGVDAEFLSDHKCHRRQCDDPLAHRGAAEQRWH